MKILMLLLLSVFFSSCAFWRGVFHGAPNIDDYKIFPQATIKKAVIRFILQNFLLKEKY